MLTMRRYENPQSYLDSFQSAAQKLRSPEVLDKMEAVSADDDEEFCEDKCIEIEQIEAEQTPEIQEDFVQLTLF